MSARTLSSILFMFITSLVLAQPAFYASVNEEKVYLGSYFKLEYQLSNARGSAFKPPSFKGFRVVGGPNRSFQQTIVNGKADAFESYTYTLLAEKIGDFTLPPATIRVNNKTLKSNPVSIKVLKPLKQDDLGQSATTSGQDFFVVAELSNDTAYPGQQILLDYKLYSRIKIDRFEFRASPQFRDFYTQQINLLRRTTQKVDISGNIYNVQLLKRIALFPQRSGEFEIDPAHVLLMVPERSRRRSFFFDNYETKFVHTNALTLNVIPIPEPMPASFSGLVGNYTVECRPGKRRITTDDVLSYQLILRGDGDPNLLNIPDAPVIPELEVYDPSINQKNTDQHQNRLNHYAILDYLYVASSPGIYELQPEISFFNPDSNSYVYYKSNPIRYTVAKGRGLSSTTGIVDKMGVYQLIDNKPRNRSSSALFGKPLYWILLLLPMLIGTGHLLRLWWIRRFVPAPPPKSRMELAIEALRDLKEQDNILSHRIEEVLGNYLRDHFQIEESEWSVQQLEKEMLKRGIDDKLTRSFADLINKCAYAAYSGMNTSMSHSIIDESIELLEQLVD